MNEPLVNLLRRAVAIQREGRRCVLCLVVGSRGSTPQEAGALMLVDDAAMSFGTIGGGCVEAEVRREAFTMLSRGASGALRFKLNHDYGWDDGLICGGTLEVVVAPPPTVAALERVIEDVGRRVETGLELAVDERTESQGADQRDGGAGGRRGDHRSEIGYPKAEPSVYRLRIPPRERLYIAGAGHVGQAVARLALTLEFEVHVFDDRGDLMAQALAADASAVVGEIADRLAAAPVDAGTYCLIVTRGHRHDEQALRAVVGRGAAYVGMIGSRRKVKLIFDDLEAMGVPRHALAGVRAPVGLDIGGVSVEEIAVSIAAELVQVRRRVARDIVARLSGPDAFDCPGEQPACAPVKA